jgi:hypothetical protein
VGGELSAQEALMLMLAGLGETTYQTAQKVAAALTANDYWSAAGLMSALSPADLAEVAKKSIALGADPDMIKSLVDTLGQTEVIEVSSTAPKPVPVAAPGMPTWAKLLLGAVIVGGGVYAYKKLRP